MTERKIKNSYIFFDRTNVKGHAFTGNVVAHDVVHADGPRHVQACLNDLDLSPSKLVHTQDLAVQL